jgi:hypothetical protein
MLRVYPKNSDALKTVSMSGLFSKLNIHSVGPAQQTKQCAYNIPSDCGRCYISETSRPLEVSIKEHKYNPTQGLLEKSKLAQRVYEEGHKICWNEKKVLQIEPDTTYRKYTESTHIL